MSFERNEMKRGRRAGRHETKHWTGRCLLGLAVAVLGASNRALAEPYGDPFVISRSTPPDAIPLGKAETAANGDTVVLWSGNHDGGRSSFLQRYDARGDAFYDEAEDAPDFASVLAVAPDGTYALGEHLYGGFAVTIYNRFGEVITPRFRPFEGSGLALHAMEFRPDGQLALAISEAGYVYVATCDRSGIVTSAYLVDEPPAPGLRVRGVALDFDDTLGAAVAWEIHDEHGQSSVLYRRFSSAGEPWGRALPVDAHALGRQSLGELSFTAQGDFVVTWREAIHTAGQWSARVFARTFDAGGSPLTDPLPLVSSETMAGFDTAQDVDGDVSVVWVQCDGVDECRVYLQSYSAAGEPSTERLVVNEPGFVATAPSVGVGPYGEVFVTWTDIDLSTSPAEGYVMGRRFSPPNIPIRSVGATPILDNAAQQGEWIYYSFEVPPSHETLEVGIAGGMGDADLYLRYGALPRLDAWDARPYRWGNDERVTARGNVVGTWFIGLHAYQSFQDVALRVSSY